MTKWKIYNEDAVEWAKNYRKAKFHALLCDAPYHLTSIVKRFGKKNSAPAKEGTDGVFRRASSGFMGQEWDGGDLAFRPETWEAFGEVLHPGAFGMAFSASRNWHRMAVAIEDAGFISLQPSALLEQANILAYARENKDWNLVETVEMWMREQAGIKDALISAGFILHPTIFLWSYGQGFPKATNISKQLDKGKEGEIVGKKKLWGHNAGSGAGSFSKNQYEGHTGEVRYEDVHAPASEMSSAWQGHRYGLQALKPAVEPIIVFQKPYESRPLDNIIETGAGALNIDGGRIPTQDEYVINQFDDGMKPWGNGAGHKYKSIRVPQSNPKNRSGVVGTDLGISNSDIKKFQESQRVSTENMVSKGRWPANLILDEGSAERLDAQTGTLQSGKPSGKKRADNNIYGKYKNENIDVSGFGDNGGASRFFYNVSQQLDESDPVYYCSKVSPRERNAGLEEKNSHPTLKPIDLCRYLATLLLPPVEYAPRRIFIPFSGVASEMIGAGLAGWEHVVGVEFDTENGYVDIAEKRLQHWLKEQK